MVNRNKIIEPLKKQTIIDMKHTFFIISILFAIFVQSTAQTNQCDNFFVQFIGEKDDDFEFELINNTQDTLHLFDSYLQTTNHYAQTIDSSLKKTENTPYLYQSKYLHRFDEKTRQCKLSLLPLLPYLGLRTHSPIILGVDKVARNFQVVYHFRTIPPNSRNKIEISRSAFYTEDYVYEVYPQKISKFERGIKFHKSNNDCCSNIVVEFALYKNIDLLRNEQAYYYDEYKSNDQALSYTVLSVSIDLPREQTK